MRRIGGISIRREKRQNDPYLGGGVIECDTGSGEPLLQKPEHIFDCGDGDGVSQHGSRSNNSDGVEPSRNSGGSGVTRGKTQERGAQTEGHA